MGISAKDLAFDLFDILQLHIWAQHFIFIILNGNFYTPINNWKYRVIFSILVQETAGSRDRILNIHNSKLKQTRVLIHVELTCWTGPDLPSALGPLLQAVDHTVELAGQQRSPGRPVLLHCRDGGNKSGTLCAVMAALAAFQVPNSGKRSVIVPWVWEDRHRIWKKRKDDWFRVVNFLC